MEEDARKFLEKALESLASAESDLTGGRNNSCANRCYYACFQAAISAFLQANIAPTGIWVGDTTSFELASLVF